MKRANMVKIVSLLLLVPVAISIFAGAAFADSTTTCVFTGTVQAGGEEVAGGTLITAIIDGVKYYTHTQTSYNTSTYKFTIIPPDGKSYPDGTLVSFMIDEYPAEQTSIFQAGANFRLNLTSASTITSGISNSGATYPYAGSSDAEGSFNWGVIVGLLMAMLAAGALAYYVILIRRVVRKGLLKRKVEVGSNPTEKHIDPTSAVKIT